MRLLWFTLAVASAALCSAQPKYSSSIPPEPEPAKGFDWTSLLTSGPVEKLLSSFGINITEQIDLAKRRAFEAPWDERIELVADENFHDKIVYEEMTEEEEEKRLWFLIITMGMTKEPISTFVDQQFDLAYNISLEADDLPHVRWGRIDYMNVTAITTRWFVWKAPMLVVAHNRGQTLRFYKPGEIRLVPEMLYQFLKQDGWRETDPWTGSFAPGGRYEPWIFQCGELAAKGYKIVARTPKWLMLIVSGAAAFYLVNFLHQPAEKAPAARRRIVRRAAPTTETTASTADTNSSLRKRINTPSS